MQSPLKDKAKSLHLRKTFKLNVSPAAEESGVCTLLFLFKGKYEISSVVMAQPFRLGLWLFALLTSVFFSHQVVFCMDRALEFAPACHRFKILKAECLALLGRYPEAQSVAR